MCLTYINKKTVLFTINSWKSIGHNLTNIESNEVIIVGIYSWILIKRNLWNRRNGNWKKETERKVIIDFSFSDLLYRRYHNNFKNISSSGIPGPFFVSPSYKIPCFVCFVFCFFSLLFFHYFAFENVDFHNFFNIFYVIPLHFLQGINLLYHLSFFGVSVISSLIKLQNFNKKKLDLIKKILNLITVFKSVFSCKSWNRSNYNSRLINSCDRSWPGISDLITFRTLHHSFS